MNVAEQNNKAGKMAHGSDGGSGCSFTLATDMEMGQEPRNQEVRGRAAQDPVCRLWDNAGD